MRNQLFKILITLFFTVLGKIYAQGPPPPPPPPPGGCATCIPIDQGSLFLLIGALGLGLVYTYKMKKQNSKKRVELQPEE
jgi:hypothetical protein